MVYKHNDLPQAFNVAVFEPEILPHTSNLFIGSEVVSSCWDSKKRPRDQFERHASRPCCTERILKMEFGHIGYHRLVYPNTGYRHHQYSWKSVNLPPNALKIGQEPHRILLFPFRHLKLSVSKRKPFSRPLHSYTHESSPPFGLFETQN